MENRFGIFSSPHILLFAKDSSSTLHFECYVFSHLNQFNLPEGVGK